MRVESGITSSPSTSTGTSGWPLTSITGERSSYEISTDSTSRPLWASASATRSTFVEKGALKRRSIARKAIPRGSRARSVYPPAVPGDPPDRGVLCPAALTDWPCSEKG